MLLFRYFGSYAFESLRDAELKTSTVNSLNDPFELLYQLVGAMTPTKAKRYIKRRVKADDFFRVAQLRDSTIKSKKDLKRFVATNRDTIVKNLVTSYTRLGAENFVATMAETTLRIVCFSESTVEPLDEILIWSHYANKHTGIRIGFEFPEAIAFPFKIVPVEYRKERVALNLSDGADTNQVKTALMEMIKVKSRAWQYERERRLITSPNFCELKQTQNGQHAHFFKFDREWVKFVDFGLRSIR